MPRSSSFFRLPPLRYSSRRVALGGAFLAAMMVSLLSAQIDQRLLAALDGCRVTNGADVEYAIVPAVHEFGRMGTAEIFTNEGCTAHIFVTHGGVFTRVRPTRPEAPFIASNGIQIGRIRSVVSLAPGAALAGAEVEVWAEAATGRHQVFKFRYSPPPPPADFPPARMAPGESVPYDYDSFSLALQSPDGAWKSIDFDGDEVNGVRFIIIREMGMFRMTVLPDAAHGVRHARVNGVPKDFTIGPRVPVPARDCTVRLGSDAGEVFTPGGSRSIVGPEAVNLVLHLSPECESVEADGVVVNNGAPPIGRPSGFRVSRRGPNVTIIPTPRDGQAVTINAVRTVGGARVEQLYTFTRILEAPVDLPAAVPSPPSDTPPPAPGDCVLTRGGSCVALVIHPGRAPVCTNDPRYETAELRGHVRRKFQVPAGAPTFAASKAECERSEEFRRADEEFRRAGVASRPVGDPGTPVAACVGPGEACSSTGRSCCAPAPGLRALTCTRLAGAAEDSDTLCVTPGGRMVAGSPCRPGQCGIGQTGNPKLVCPPGPRPACCLNKPDGGADCWDRFRIPGDNPGAFQLAQTQWRLSAFLSPASHWCNSNREFVARTPEILVFCRRLEEELGFQSETLQELLGQ